MPDTRNHQRNAETCDSSREGLTGAKFWNEDFKWTRIGPSCHGHLQTKTKSNILEEKYVMSNMNEEK
jgi:hypothetical protein